MNVLNEPVQINQCNSAEGHFEEITDAASIGMEILITEGTRRTTTYSPVHE